LWGRKTESFQKYWQQRQSDIQELKANQLDPLGLHHANKRIDSDSDREQNETSDEEDSSLAFGNKDWFSWFHEEDWITPSETETDKQEVLEDEESSDFPSDFGPCV
jgi:hypothetical protein